jgi:hypothetical protein
MKKILLIIFTIILILSINVLAVDIDIGSPAIDRGSSFGVFTTINSGNPANSAGIISSVEIWALINLLNCEVATFYGSGTTYSTRDHEAIGTVTSGSKQTFGVDLDVEIGDFIGIYYTDGNIERDTSGFDGCWSKGGDLIPCTNETGWSAVSGDAISLYGTGAEITVGGAVLNRGSSKAPEITYATRETPATGTGTITTIELWAQQNMTGVIVAIFTEGEPEFLTARDHVHLADADTTFGEHSVSNGNAITLDIDSNPISLDIVEGDFIGFYAATGNLESDSSGYAGTLIESGNHTECVDREFNDQAGDGMSLRGLGATVVGWDHKWNTQTISKWNIKEIIKWNELE